MIENEKLQEIAMTVIANAGQARSDAFEAVQKAKKEDFPKAEECLKRAKDNALCAHKAHTELLTMDARGELEGLDILLTHAQDHFMMADLALDMAKELVEVYQALHENKKTQ